MIILLVKIGICGFSSELGAIYSYFCLYPLTSIMSKISET